MTKRGGRPETRGGRPETSGKQRRRWPRRLSVWCYEWIGFRVTSTEEYIYKGGNLGWPPAGFFSRAEFKMAEKIWAVSEFTGPKRETGLSDFLIFSCRDFFPCLGVPLGAPKMISKPMVRSTQTVHLYCVKISTTSEWTELSLEPHLRWVPSGVSKMIS
jgi:hypothetical protein